MEQAVSFYAFFGQNWAAELLVPALAAAVIAYLCGCFNGAVIVSKYILRDDVRTHGSGNAGLTNFFRTFGGLLTFLVILCDVLKAVAALEAGVWLSSFYTGILYDTVTVDPFVKRLVFQYWAALFCLIGHMFPCMFHFRGGKGVLSGGVAAIMIDWRVAVVVWGGFLVLFFATRYVSLGSIWAGATFPLISVYVFRSWLIFLLALGVGGLILWKHRENMKRLVNGTESKLSFHRHPMGGGKS